MSATMVAWLRKIISWNRLQWLKILLTFEGIGDVSFHYKPGFFKELLKANLSFQMFQLTEGFGVQMRVCNFYVLLVQNMNLFSLERKFWNICDQQIVQYLWGTYFTNLFTRKIFFVLSVCWIRALKKWKYYRHNWQFLGTLFNYRPNFWDINKSTYMVTVRKLVDILFQASMDIRFNLLCHFNEKVDQKNLR